MFTCFFMVSDGSLPEIKEIRLMLKELSGCYGLATSLMLVERKRS